MGDEQRQQCNEQKQKPVCVHVCVFGHSLCAAIFGSAPLSVVHHITPSTAGPNRADWLTTTSLLRPVSLLSSSSSPVLDPVLVQIQTGPVYDDNDCDASVYFITCFDLWKWSSCVMFVTVATGGL